MGFRQDYSEEKLCPRCGQNLLPIGYPGALSRLDNKTEICSPCGNDEAFRDFYGDPAVTLKDWPLVRKYNLPW